MVLAAKVAHLQSRLRELSSLLIALSGGVDSAVLLALAARSLPGRVGAATTHSPAVPEEEVDAAAAIARQWGVPHIVVETHEIDDPDYRANAGDRCYFCRRAMYGGLDPAEQGYAALADGLQADDLLDDRPGVRAAREHGVLHPLREAGLGKADLRRLAWGLGLPVHDKPAQPCLASRLPVGVVVTRERLAHVHAAESALRARGYRELRVRCEDRHARIEVGATELARALSESAELEALALESGFATAALDPAGYRAPTSGRAAAARPAPTA
ncbi:MAG: ATP-dependent sacrificial sulfur transferase LarE [Planctomycetota bacterium]